MARIKRKLYNIFHPVVGDILMLHRVTGVKSILNLNLENEITPEYLEKIILGYKEKGYCFISIEEVYNLLQGKLKLKMPFVCFTFDDGYKDNYEIAYPILKKHHIPFIIYVSTDFIDHKAFIWWYILEDIIVPNKELRLSDGTFFKIETVEEKNKVFNEIHGKLSKLEPKFLQGIFEDWFSAYLFDFEKKVRELSLNHDQLINLLKESLCTIGSHTVTHSRLENMSIDEQREELTYSKQKLKFWLGEEVNHLAYPFGSHTDETVKLAKEAGYKTAVISWGGRIREGQDLYRLRREILQEK